MHRRERQPAEEKAALRRVVLARRRQLPQHVRTAGADAVRRRLAALPALRGRPAVVGYAALPDELDVDGLLRDLQAEGCTVHLPWVDGPRLLLAAVTCLSADLEPGWRGVREPAAASRRAVEPDRIDVVLVPGVAFDARGGRLGYGGGHFDRLLARLRPDAVTVGIGFDEQVVDAVPAEAHDRRVDLVVTPTRTLHRRAR